MAIKYISKKDSDTWKISTTKSGKSVKNFNTQEEAIKYAMGIKTTEAIFIKKGNTWNKYGSLPEGVLPSKLEKAETNPIVEEKISKNKIVKTDEGFKLAVPKTTKQSAKPGIELAVEQTTPTKIIKKHPAVVMREKALISSILSLFIIIVVLGIVFTISWLII